MQHKTNNCIVNIVCNLHDSQCIIKHRDTYYEEMMEQSKGHSCGLLYHNDALVLLNGFKLIHKL